MTSGWICSIVFETGERCGDPVATTFKLTLESPKLLFALPICDYHRGVLAGEVVLRQMEAG